MRVGAAVVIQGFEAHVSPVYCDDVYLSLMSLSLLGSVRPFSEFFQTLNLALLRSPRMTEGPIEECSNGRSSTC